MFGVHVSVWRDRPCGEEVRIRHALTRLKRLRPYLEHGFPEIDNNPAERAMRPIELGRKNYLFMGSVSGGRAPPSPTP